MFRSENNIPYSSNRYDFFTLQSSGLPFTVLDTTPPVFKFPPTSSPIPDVGQDVSRRHDNGEKTVN